MDGDFSAAAVVGEVVGEAEGFLAEGGGKFLLLFDLLAAVVVILGAYALCAVVRFVFKVAERECPRAEAILLRIRFACNDRALEAGVFLDVDVEAVFSSEDAGLASGTSIVGVDQI